MKDAAWPSDLILDITKSNWTEWDHMLSLAVHQCGIRPYLEGEIPCPDVLVSPDAYHVWKHNDDSLSAFITRYISKSDVIRTKDCKTAATLYKRLESLHQNQGVYAQLTLLTKALQIRLKYDTPLSETAAEIINYHTQIMAIGSLKDDDIRAALLLHSMSDAFPHLQDVVQNMTHLPNFSSEMILQRIYSEDALIRRRQELGIANPTPTVPLPSQTAFAAQSRPSTTKVICTHCKRTGHSADYCIAPGGKMAGRTVDEARAAWRATLPRTSPLSRPSSNSIPSRPCRECSRSTSKWGSSLSQGGY